MGNSLYKNNLSNEARFNYNQSLAKLNSKEDLHKAFHNLGNTFMKDKNYQGAVDNFKKALLNNPDDEETRYNYVPLEFNQLTKLTNGLMKEIAE